MISALGLSLVASVLAIHIEEKEGISAADTDALVALLMEELAPRYRAGARAIDTRKIELTCPKDQPCGAEINARTGAKEVVYLRIFGIPTKIRVIAESAGESKHTSSIDLPRKQWEWRARIASLGNELFPPPPVEVVAAKPPPKLETAPKPELVTAPPLKVEEDSRPIAPWIVLGAGVALGGAAAVFGIKNRSAVSEGEKSTDPARVDELLDEVDSTGLTANILFLSSAVTVAVGAGWILIEELSAGPGHRVADVR